MAVGPVEDRRRADGCCNVVGAGREVLSGPKVHPRVNSGKHDTSRHGSLLDHRGNQHVGSIEILILQIQKVLLGSIMEEERTLHGKPERSRLAAQTAHIRRESSVNQRHD